MGSSDYSRGQSTDGLSCEIETDKRDREPMASNQFKLSPLMPDRKSVVAMTSLVSYDTDRPQSPGRDK